MSAIYEGFGMPIIESLTSGTPVVASDIPVLREAGGDAVLYAQPKNPDDFTKKMLSIITNPQKARLDMKATAQAHLNTICWQDNTDRLIAAFKGAIAAKKRHTN